MPTYTFHGHEHTIPDHLADFQQIPIANGYMLRGEPDDETQTQEYRDWFRSKWYARQHFLVDRQTSEYETEQFRDEMADHVDIYGPGLGVQYHTRTINRDSGGTPLVVNFGLGTSSETVAGRAALNTLSSQTGRRIISLDPVGLGGSSKARKKGWGVEEMASSNLKVLRDLGVTTMNVMGYSWGGMVAGNLAKAAGKDVENLITVSAPGFRYGLGSFIMSMPKTALLDLALAKLSAGNCITRENMSAAEHTDVRLINKKQLGACARLAAQTLAPSLASLAHDLSPETNWIDIIASKDGLTPFNDHLAVVRERRSLGVPGKSEIHMLGKEKHTWTVNTPAWATVVATTLTRLEEY